MNDPQFWSRFVIATFAAWRIAHLFTKEDGPADVIFRARAALGDGLAGRLLDCFYCVSVWVAAPLALLVCSDPIERLLTWIALSGAACLFERVSDTDDNEAIRKAVADELLRPETGNDASHGRAAETGSGREGIPAAAWIGRVVHGSGAAGGRPGAVHSPALPLAPLLTSARR